MQLATSRLEITYLRTTSVKPDPRNPRVHSDKQIRQIAQSLGMISISTRNPGSVDAVRR